MKSHTPARDRRDLLKLLVSAPIAATAVAAAPAQAQATVASESKTANYSETDHVRRYYATLRGQ
ncbi:formate dehydrogenase [Ferrimonas lipolytica]|uniref:Formate dehydrogenase n=1 Tax=Ferrimonas lipolytica TaxID=2724191 RepID=A0A6H1UHK4_9GAMM|nr:formate dehydrogenase [Ferrimonas lipolytica]QIZ78308.1 formate dehydrogenase [Ferrimonas lipolytica]